jgi:hypothetical protein
MYYQCEDIRVSVEALIRSEVGQKDSYGSGRESRHRLE